MNYLSSIFSLSLKRFKDADAHDLGAALSYFTLFSLVPLISIIVLIISFFLDKQTAMTQLIVFFRDTAGPGVASFIQEMVQSNNSSPSSIFASVLAFLVLVYGVTNLTSQLQNSLDRILGSVKQDVSFWKKLEDQILSFSIVLLLSFVLTAFFLVSIGLSVFETYSSDLLHLPTLFLQIVNLLLTLLLIGSITFVTFRFLPHIKRSVKAILLGSVFTSVLFIIGKYLISLYLAYSNPSTAYGAAGTLIIILLWIYYSAQILFFGACVVFAIDEKDRK